MKAISARKVEQSSMGIEKNRPPTIRTTRPQLIALSPQSKADTRFETMKTKEKGGRKKTIGVESNCERGSSTTRTNQKKNSQPRPFFFWFYKSTSRCERPAAERELKEVPMADEVKRVFSLSIFSSLRRGKKKLLLTFPLQRAPSSPRAAPRPPCPPPPRSPRSTSRRAAGP